ncbi:unnamed protein product [Rotaria magnacalcarata]|uniref:Uncharacterized protein n=3 Tax=Rotaria magnacalcarata TaxID=392030 RepID=A0A816Q8D0_9BILA|nr:unnamed protein product [Rotaria magnacalcarata]
MERTNPKAKIQSVRFHDILVQIQTVDFNGIECLCLEDVQRRFPSVTALCFDNIQLSFLRDTNGDQLIPLRIEAITDQIIEAVEPAEQSNVVMHRFLNRIDTNMQEMNKKTDIILANTQETLIRIKHVMTQMYELHEYTTPHEPDKLHIAPHDGYSIKKPSEFIASYGSYLRTTVNIVRAIFSIGGVVIPQSESVSPLVASALPPFTKESSNYTDVNSKLDVVEKMLNQTNDYQSRVDSSMIQKAVLPKVPLQGAQLRELEAFLEHVDDQHSLGNLYRITTNDGHVRWVCLEHYNAIGYHSRMSEYVRQLESIGGKFSYETKEVILTGNLTAKNITMFCDILTKGFAILTLVLENCSIDSKDLDELFDVTINRSSIQRIVIITVEVRKWMKMSKYICNYMMINLKNQSLKVQFSNQCQTEDARLLARLLRQNKICRTFIFFGYDIPINNQDLLLCLKETRELTTLVLHHFMNIEFLNEILTSNCSPSRIKLSHCFNLSSTLFGLCQAVGQNENLVDLDIMDNTCIDDKAATIELLTVLRKHKTIKNVRLHVFNIQPSNENETCLITSLLQDSFISHLRISDSIISPELIEALIHASEHRHSLTCLEFYNSQLNCDNISRLQLLYANESLTHLFISEQQYFSTGIIEIREQLNNEISHYQKAKLEKQITETYIYSSICLDNMDLVDQYMEIIVKQTIIIKQCSFISLQFNKFTSIGISILAGALTDNDTLETLNLGNNYISDSGVYFLATILAVNNHTLKTLVLQKNRITDRGAKYLARMLETNQTLLWLYLGENEISDEGVRILTQTIENQNHTLELLVFSGNKLVSDLSVDYLLQMIEHNQSLKKLWLDDCSLSETGKQRLAKIPESKKDFYIRV